MTKEELINELIDLFSHGPEGARDYYLDDEDRELIIEALEKQTPKTPDYEGDGYWDGELVYDTWKCPNCGKDYEVDYDNYKYCPECGQAIDWSDQE